MENEIIRFSRLFATVRYSGSVDPGIHEFWHDRVTYFDPIGISSCISATSSRTLNFPMVRLKSTVYGGHDSSADCTACPLVCNTELIITLNEFCYSLDI